MIDWMKQDDVEVRDESPEEQREEVLHEGVSKDEPVHVTWTAVFAGNHDHLPQGDYAAGLPRDIHEHKDRVFYLNTLDAALAREGDYSPIRPLMAEAEGGPVKSRMHVKVQ